MFKKIDTIGILPDGRVIARTISAPKGVSVEEERHIYEANARAFPNSSCTISTL